MKKAFLFVLITLTIYASVHGREKIEVYSSFSQIEKIIKPKGDSTYVINFWASWCKPCVAELPAMEKARQNLSEKKIKFILVCLDEPSKLDKTVLPLLERLKIDTYVILLDDTDYNSWIDKVDPSWSGAIPGTLLSNKNKNQFFEKSFEYNELVETINNHLIP